jgi:hypothetical protein
MAISKSLQGNLKKTDNNGWEKKMGLSKNIKCKRQKCKTKKCKM